MYSKGVRSAFQKAGLKLKVFLTGKRAIDPPRQDELACMIDGEECGVTPMHVAALPQAVNVLIPPAKAEEMGISPKKRSLRPV
jgi:diacylglycerol kinase family enzyme